MRKRVINGRINYGKGIQRNRNELLESILWTIQTEQETKWIKTTIKYMKDVNISFNDIGDGGDLGQGRLGPPHLSCLIIDQSEHIC